MLRCSHRIVCEFPMGLERECGSMCQYQCMLCKHSRPETGILCRIWWLCRYRQFSDPDSSPFLTLIHIKSFTVPLSDWSLVCVYIIAPQRLQCQYSGQCDIVNGFTCQPDPGCTGEPFVCDKRLWCLKMAEKCPNNDCDGSYECVEQHFGLRTYNQCVEYQYLWLNRNWGGRRGQEW